MHSPIQHSGSWQAKMKEIVRNEEEWSETFKVEVKGEGMQANSQRKVKKLLLETEEEDKIKVKDVRATEKKATVRKVWRKNRQKMLGDKNQELVNEVGKKHKVETSRK